MAIVKGLMCVCVGGDSHTTLIVPHLSVITVALCGAWRSQFAERVAHSTSAVNIPVRALSPAWCFSREPLRQVAVWKCGALVCGKRAFQPTMGVSWRINTPASLLLEQRGRVTLRHVFHPVS